MPSMRWMRGKRQEVNFLFNFALLTFHTSLAAEILATQS